jgi:histone H3/H4
MNNNNQPQQPPPPRLDTARSGVTNATTANEMELPTHNIRHLMKLVLPNKARVSQEAVDVMKECANEFISFVATEYV